MPYVENVIKRYAKKETLTEADITRLAKFPEVRRRLSSALVKEPIKVGISGAKGEYVHFRMEPPQKFDKRSIRTKSVGSRGTKLLVGCYKGQYDPKRPSCIVGMKTQAVLVPKLRVIEVLREIYRQIKRRKVAANPCGSVSPEHRIKRAFRNAETAKNNPLLMTIMPNPKAKIQKVSKSNPQLNPNNPEFQRALKAYKKFHLGSEPKSISRVLIPDGKKGITSSTIGVAMGRVPDEYYKPPKHSGKATDAPLGYRHVYKKKPLAVFLPKDGTILHVSKGHRVDDWIRG